MKLQKTWCNCWWCKICHIVSLLPLTDKSAQCFWHCRRGWEQEALALFLSFHRSRIGLLGDNTIMLNSNWPTSPFLHLPGSLKSHHLETPKHFISTHFLPWCIYTLVVSWSGRAIFIQADYREGLQMETLTPSTFYPTLCLFFFFFSAKPGLMNAENLLGTVYHAALCSPLCLMGCV